MTKRKVSLTVFNAMYAKVFSQIFQSSIAADHKVRHVFMDLLVLADPEGVVDMTREAICRITNVPLEILLPAIAELESPDPQSRTNTEEGRRLQRIDDHRDWGWRIVNYAAYREIKDEEARRRYFREYQRENRKRKKEEREQLLNPVKDKSHQLNEITPETERHTDTEAELKKEEKGASADSSLIPKKTLRMQAARPALTLMRELSGRPFREVEANLLPIAARLEEPGVTPEGVLQMIRREWEGCRGNPEQEYWFKPDTIFRAKNFDGHYSAKDLPPRKSGVNGHPTPAPRVKGVF